MLKCAGNRCVGRLQRSAYDPLAHHIVTTSNTTQFQQFFARLGASDTASPWANIELLELGDGDPDEGFASAVQRCVPSIAWNKAYRAVTFQAQSEPLLKPWEDAVQRADGLIRSLPTFSGGESSVEPEGASLIRSDATYFLRIFLPLCLTRLHSSRSSCCIIKSWHSNCCQR